MGGKKAVREIVFPITSYEEYQSIITNETDKVFVIDYHLEWCGPCQVIEPSFRSIFFSIEEPDSRIAFHTLNIDLLPKEESDLLDLDAKPLFRVFKNSGNQGEVRGVKVNEIHAIIT
mmetsp:Transcript_1996/g.3533  ORF Transcript_1996/g.3533 Transcript_1996/m.3533 type:complete len:117 (+) Transcript_1996:28-378(+)